RGSRRGGGGSRRSGRRTGRSRGAWSADRWGSSSQTCALLHAADEDRRRERGAGEAGRARIADRAPRLADGLRVDLADAAEGRRAVAVDRARRARGARARAGAHREVALLPVRLPRELAREVRRAAAVRRGIAAVRADRRARDLTA